MATQINPKSPLSAPVTPTGRIASFNCEDFEKTRRFCNGIRQKNDSKVDPVDYSPGATGPRAIEVSATAFKGHVHGAPATLLPRVL